MWTLLYFIPLELSLGVVLHFCWFSWFIKFYFLSQVELFFIVLFSLLDFATCFALSWLFFCIFCFFFIFLMETLLDFEHYSIFILYQIYLLLILVGCCWWFVHLNFLKGYLPSILYHNCCIYNLFSVFLLNFIPWYIVFYQNSIRFLSVFPSKRKSSFFITFQTYLKIDRFWLQYLLLLV